MIAEHTIDNADDRRNGLHDIGLATMAFGALFVKASQPELSPVTPELFATDTEATLLTETTSVLSNCLFHHLT